MSMNKLRKIIVVMSLLFTSNANADSGSALFIPVNRSSLITLNSPAAEVQVANPDIADVHVNNATNITIVAKGLGQTTVRIMDKDRAILRELDVAVGYDLPAIRKSLKNFLPEEDIGVEMVNSGIALTGQVHSAASVDKALKIARDFVKQPGQKDDATTDAPTTGAPSSATTGSKDSSSKSSSPNILNFLQVTSGQQVMLRVRVGEIQRSALKELGVDLNAISNGQGASNVVLGTGGGIASLVAPTTGQTAVSPGVFLLPGGQTPTNTQGVLGLKWHPNGANGNTYAGLLKALEQDGLFKVLAEPNLVAISGEEAEFLSGGEIPIPVVQGSGGSSSVSITYKPFGVAVKFTPLVMGESRIHMTVQPEVSEVSSSNAVEISGFKIPSIDTRRAKTTVELAPGESFMIAGLINDQTRATINQLPGAKELPILGALFRSTEFQRNETELVIAVTPYIVDPMKSSNVKLPSDNFAPASQMEMFFYGALGATPSKPQNTTPTQSLEGPTGFMVD